MALSASQAAKVLGCTTAYVCMLCKRKKISATKDDKGYWVLEFDDLITYGMRKAQRVSHVAKAYHLHPETIRRWLRANKIKGYKDDHWVVSQPQLPLPRQRRSGKKKPKK